MTSVCGTLGCHNDPEHVVRHPEHGKRAVCEEHAAETQALISMEGSA